MTTPFFSIVIPTKNRPALLRDAILSVLEQDFSDFELIVSDNFNDAQTAKVIQEFSDRPELVSVRTSKELHMPEHWEFATRIARGRYVLVLPDRRVVHQGTLRFLHNTFMSSEQEVLVCSWRRSVFDDTNNTFWDGRADGRPIFFKSEDILKDFAHTYPLETDARLPRGLNSCYRNDIAEKIRTKTGSLFLPISPDYTSAFLLLSSVPEILHIPRALCCAQGGTVSNGRNAQSNPVAYLNSLQMKDWYEGVPIKAPIINNILFRDFLFVRKILFGNANTIHVYWPAYFASCYEEIKNKYIYNTSADSIREWHMAWKKSVNSLKPKTRFLVRIEQIKCWGRIALIYIRYSSLGIPIKKGLRFFFGPSFKKTNNVLEATGFSPHV